MSDTMQQIHEMVDGRAVTLYINCDGEAIYHAEISNGITDWIGNKGDSIEDAVARLYNGDSWGVTMDAERIDNLHWRNNPEQEAQP